MYGKTLSVLPFVLMCSMGIAQQTVANYLPAGMALKAMSILPFELKMVGHRRWSIVMLQSQRI